MKKIMAVLSAMFVLACGMMMTGCEDDVWEEVAPKDKWCVKTIEGYKASDEATASSITCHMYYTEKEAYTGSKINGDISSKIKPGLTIVIIPDPKSDLASKLTENKYLVVNLPKDKNYDFETTGEENEEGEKPFKVEMNDGLWSLFCLGNPTMVKEATTKPDTILSMSSWSSVTDGWEALKENFSVKSLLKSLLLTYLDS